MEFRVCSQQDEKPPKAVRFLDFCPWECFESSLVRSRKSTLNRFWFVVFHQFNPEAVINTSLSTKKFCCFAFVLAVFLYNLDSFLWSLLANKPWAWPISSCSKPFGYTGVIYQVTFSFFVTNFLLLLLRHFGRNYLCKTFWPITCCDMSSMLFLVWYFEEKDIMLYCKRTKITDSEDKSGTNPFNIKMWCFSKDLIDTWLLWPTQSPPCGSLPLLSLLLAHIR